MKRVADGVVCDTDAATIVSRFGWPDLVPAAACRRPQKRRETLYRISEAVLFLHTEIWSDDAQDTAATPRLETVDLMTEADATAWLANPTNRDR